MLGELAKLRISSMSWVSCTVSWMSWLNCTVSLMSWISCTDMFDELAKLRMSSIFN